MEDHGMSGALLEPSKEEEADIGKLHEDSSSQPELTPQDPREKKRENGEESEKIVKKKKGGMKYFSQKLARFKRVNQSFQKKNALVIQNLHALVVVERGELRTKVDNLKSQIAQQNLQVQTLLQHLVFQQQIGRTKHEQELLIDEFAISSPPLNLDASMSESEQYSHNEILQLSHQYKMLDMQIQKLSEMVLNH